MSFILPSPQAALDCNCKRREQYFSGLVRLGDPFGDFRLALLRGEDFTDLALRFGAGVLLFPGLLSFLRRCGDEGDAAFFFPFACVFGDFMVFAKCQAGMMVNCLNVLEKMEWTVIRNRSLINHWCKKEEMARFECQSSYPRRDNISLMGGMWARWFFLFLCQKIFQQICFVLFNFAFSTNHGAESIAKRLSLDISLSCELNRLSHLR